MKKLKYAVILLFGLSMVTMMTSCNKDGGGNVYENKIVGEWQVIKATGFTYGVTGELIQEEDLEEDWYEDMYYRFMSNGMVVMNEMTNSNTERVIVPYLIEGNTLYMGFYLDVDENVFTIKELTNSKMVWEQELTSSYSAGYKFVYIYDLKKVN